MGKRGACVKRPAAATPAAASEKKARKIASADADLGLVRAGATVNQILTAAEYVRTELQEELPWGSCFDGTNMPAYALLQLGVPGRHGFGAETSPAPALQSEELQDEGSFVQGHSVCVGK